MTTKRTLRKAQRMTILNDAKEQGILIGLPLWEIAHIFFVSKSTICRDLQDLQELNLHRQSILDKLKAHQKERE